MGPVTTPSFYLFHTDLLALVCTGFYNGMVGGISRWFLDYSCVTIDWY